MIKKQADPKSLPEAKAERVRSTRAILSLSRREIEERYGINENTLSGWERAIHGGLSRKGAAKLVEILKDNRIHCTIDWFMHGIGAGLQRIYDDPAPAAYPEESIGEELAVFRKKIKNALDYVVPDNSMAPAFYAGDYVAGIQHKQNFKNYIGLDCIVETAAGEILLRKLAKGTTDNRYSLICVDPDSALTQNRDNIAILSLAPVIFIRRTEPNLLKQIKTVD